MRAMTAVEISGVGGLLTFTLTDETDERFDPMPVGPWVEVGVADFDAWVDCADERIEVGVGLPCSEVPAVAVRAGDRVVVRLLSA